MFRKHALRRFYGYKKFTDKKIVCCQKLPNRNIPCFLNLDLPIKEEITYCQILPSRNFLCSLTWLTNKRKNSLLPFVSKYQNLNLNLFFSEKEYFFLLALKSIFLVEFGSWYFLVVALSFLVPIKIRHRRPPVKGGTVCRSKSYNNL